MTTYTLTVSTNDLGLGVINGARVTVDRKRTQVTDVFNGQSISKNNVATNSSGIATIPLEPDDGSVYHELKIFDLAGILVYSKIFTMPPQAVAVTALPIQDIISSSATQAVAASVTATAQAVISTEQTVIATTQAVISTAQAVIATAQAAIATDKAVLTAADRVQTGLDVISANSARDAALIQAGVYTTEPLGRAAVADGQAFKVQGSGDIAAYEYRRVNADSSTLIATYPSYSLIAPFSGVLSKNTTGVGGYLRAFTDKYGRLLAGIRSTGTVYVGSLQAKTATLTTATINALTISTSRVFGVLTATLNSNVSGVLSAVTDKYGRKLRSDNTDGTVTVSKLRNAAGVLVYPLVTTAQSTADTALALATSVGLSDSKKALVAAQANGFYPQPSTVATITVGTSGAASAIASSVSVDKDNAALRYMYGKKVVGGVSYPDYVGNKWQSANYGGGYIISNGGAVEFEYTGQRIEFLLLCKGYGAQLRVLYKDLPSGIWKKTAIATTALDGGFRYILVDFQTSASRRIRFETSGHYFCGLQREPAATVTASSVTAPPIVCMMGDSFIEQAGASGACTGMSFVMGRALGIDIYSSGVGGTGVNSTGGLNPAGGQKVNYQTRVTDATSITNLGAFIIWQSINDAGFTQAQQHDGLEAIITTFRASKPTTPIIIIGPTAPTGTVTQPLYLLRDAGRQVANEYGCHFIDQLQPHCLVGTGRVGATTGSGNADYYVGTDNVHPSQDGHDYRGELLAQQIRSIIFTEF